MRRSNDYTWLSEPEQVPYGINLGADYCAEHEWGIKGLQALFGIAVTHTGITGRAVQKVPDGCIGFSESKKGAILVVGESYTVEHTLAQFRKDPEKLRELTRLEPWHLPHKGKGKTYRPVKDCRCEKCDPERAARENARASMACAWDEGSFGINVAPEHIVNLRAIHHELVNRPNNVAIWLGGGGAFQNAGLVIAIISQVPEKLKQQMLDSDNDYLARKKASEDAGLPVVKVLLKEKGKNWFSLDSTRWDGEKPNIRVWLNPSEQQKYNSGWFTIEELRLWADDKGPIVKSPVLEEKA